MSRRRQAGTEKGFRIAAAVLFLLLLASSAMPVPEGPQITSFQTETPSVRAAANITTAGGTITTMLLNATTQNPHWKAYVGNITGRLTLRDANNYTIYDWSIAEPTGEVYVSRNNSISWSSIQCANLTHIRQEEALMNHTPTATDSIENTFSLGTHDAFYAGSVSFSQNQCNFTTATYVNSTNQSTYFQEIALYDGSSIVYTTFIEQNAQGFDFQKYDFQLIVPEKGWEGPVSSTPYYFYVELV